ncbi:hypothetical protein C6376_04465 [Streptomyces sp. P3]|uniref:MFS transporter n=1 Tax=Streptomyces sp. P3 TaxID=2135430 RepID=UPI000D1A0DE9|nr:MFS transporter [Streptomyces sp. P3]AVV40796.1 hypothetical protein C6376_04465 [Streptomyces sp. P3]
MNASGAGPDPRRWWALAALVTSMLTLGFDTTILNVALPTMAERLGATTGEQQWMADSYVVVFAALMLPAGLLGDRFGRRRMLVAGLGIFFAGSLLGALAGDVASVGIALLGSLLAGTFRDRLDVTGLPAGAADTAGDSVVATRLIAERTQLTTLAGSADDAYVHGMGLVLLVCAAAALASALPTAAFLPGSPRVEDAGPRDAGPDVVAPRSDARQ